MSLILHKYLLILNFCLCFISGQTLKLEIKEYRPFPAEIDLLELKPTKFNWSIGNRFILLDEVKNQLLEINLSGKLNLPTGDGIENSVYGQIIWMGVAPEGIRVVDRLENEILHLDYRLNSIQKTLIDPRLYPEMVTMNSWGIMYLYSKTYNAIYSSERSRINSIPFIDLSKERLPSNCFIDMFGVVSKPGLARERKARRQDNAWGKGGNVVHEERNGICLESKEGSCRTFAAMKADGCNRWNGCN